MYLEAKNFGLGEGQGFAVYFDETFSSLKEWLSVGSTTLLQGERRLPCNVRRRLLRASY